MGASDTIRESIRRRSADTSLVGLWDVVHEVEVKEPKKAFAPHLWKWAEIRPLLIDAGMSVPLAESDRRVLILSNPSVFPKHHSTNTLYVSCSIYNGGEQASVHRHTPNASRFVLEGSGGYTNIEGERCSMSRGDLIITPNGTWHDHGNDGTEPVLWVDVLDLPLVEALGATSFEFDYFEKNAGGVTEKKAVQAVSASAEHSINLYGTGGLRPTFVSHQRGEGNRGTPMFVYRWEQTRKALEAMRDYAGSPSDGIMLEYVNPVNGEAVTTTMSFSVQLLRGGQATRSHRHTSSAAYCCLSGRGKTVVGSTVMEWGENDLFVVPSWAPHHHVNLEPGRDAVLYSVSDAPALKRLGLYREEDG